MLENVLRSSDENRPQMQCYYSIQSDASPSAIKRRGRHLNFVPSGNGGPCGVALSPTPAFDPYKAFGSPWATYHHHNSH